MERLQKIIAMSGYCSRRKAEELIKQGKVVVNGSKVKELGFKASLGDEIVVDGKLINVDDKVYYLLYKPAGCLSNASDKKNRQVASDFIEEETKRLFPVAKLDYDTSGILILTNDGTFADTLSKASALTNQAFQARLDGIIDPGTLKTLEYGVVINGFKQKRLKIKIKDKDTKNSSCLVDIKYVGGNTLPFKEIFNRVKYQPKKIKRIQYGELLLGDLKPKQYRKLSVHEVKRLLHLAKHGK
jgi:23S rRNA pseudouridine2605 synthase